MEKRLLLAFVLSFLVLFIWSGLNPQRPQRTQTVDNIEDAAYSESENQPKAQPTAQTVTDTANQVASAAVQTVTQSAGAFPLQVKSLQNDKLSLEFSNRGGGLSKVKINHLDSEIPIKDIVQLNAYSNSEFKMYRMDNKNIHYSFNDNGLQILKDYKISDDDYIVQSEITISNESNTSLNFDNSKILYRIDFKEEIANKDEWNKKYGRDQGLFEYIIYSHSGIKRKNNAYKFKDKEDSLVNDKVDWAAFRTRYTCAIIKPDFTTENYKIEKKDDNILNMKVDEQNTIINPGEQLKYSFIMYFGPEDTKILKSYDQDFEKVKRFYKLSLFDAPAKIIYALLHFINGFIPNLGICIILIATIIYGVTYPLTYKSMSSMKRMQEISPKLGALKEKYKDNPQRLNKEMMDIYKEHKINPLAGCIPILLQMPVFVGLYQVLWRDPSFKGASFLWIKDLSMPDRLIEDLPIIGLDLNILPLLMGVIMFIQQKITTKSMKFADKDQETQQKMMAKIMPIFMGVIFYGFASGINLYFTLFYIFSAISQWKMSKVKNV